MSTTSIFQQISKGVKDGIVVIMVLAVAIIAGDFITETLLGINLF